MTEIVEVHHLYLPYRMLSFTGFKKRFRRPEGISAGGTQRRRCADLLPVLCRDHSVRNLFSLAHTLLACLIVVNHAKLQLSILANRLSPLLASFCRLRTRRTLRFLGTSMVKSRSRSRNLAVRLSHMLTANSNDRNSAYANQSTADSPST
jgi:hypothetical protein